MEAKTVSQTVDCNFVFNVADRLRRVLYSVTVKASDLGMEAVVLGDLVVIVLH
jgi:hypothetical protein